MEHIRKIIKALEARINAIVAVADAEGRALTATENQHVNELRAELDHQRKSLPVNGPITVQGISRRSDGPFASFGEQLQAIMRAGLPGGQTDPRLHEVRAAASGLNETTPSDGGFLVQTDFTTEILRDAFAEGELAKLCRRQPISANANGIKINGVDETSRATGSRYGGVRSYWLAEAEEKIASKPKFRAIELALKKNVVLIYATDELLADAQALDGFIREVAPKEIAFQVDDAIIRGSGAGQPLGILNAGCLVTVSKEAGQDSATILSENVMKMVARTLGKTSNYVWLHSKTTLPQIYQLALSVGTGGVPLFIPAGGINNTPENRLLGLPLIELEQCSALGTVGDLILADLRNGYVVADKGGVDAAVSIHVRFVYDESVFRFVFRVDGQPVRASALTPYQGGAGNTQSHFVALETR